MAIIALLANTDLRTFLLPHRVDVIDASPPPEDYRKAIEYDEKILSTDPYKIQFTWTVDGDTLLLTVDDELNVVEVRKGQDSKND